MLSSNGKAVAEEKSSTHVESARKLVKEQRPKVPSEW